MSQILVYDLAGAGPNLRFSPYCWKIRMALAHKDLAATYRPWRFTETSELPPGHATVPTLIDGAHVVGDSWRIACDLETRYPERPSLFGPAGPGLVLFLNTWADTVLNPLIARLVVNDVYTVVAEKDRAYFMASREQRFGMPLADYVADRPAHLAAFRAALKPFRAVLSEQSFLAGAAPDYADYCCFGAFMWARCVSAADILTHDDPIFAWRDRLLDAFDGLARCAPTADI